MDYLAGGFSPAEYADHTDNVAPNRQLISLLPISLIRDSFVPAYSIYVQNLLEKSRRRLETVCGGVSLMYQPLKR